MGNNSVPKFIFRLSRFPVYRGSVLGRFYCIMKSCLLGSELFHTDGPKPVVAFRNFAKASESENIKATLMVLFDWTSLHCPGAKESEPADQMLQFNKKLAFWHKLNGLCVSLIMDLLLQSALQPLWVLACSTIVEYSQQEGFFYRVPLPAARQTPNLED